MTEYVQLKSFRVQLTQDGWQESNFCDIFISTPKKVRLQWLNLPGWTIRAASGRPHRAAKGGSPKSPIFHSYNIYAAIVRPIWTKSGDI